MFVYLSALLLFLGGYKVQGSIDPAYNGKYIYLYGIDYSGANPKLNDSCMITNGGFHFEGELVTPGMLVSLYLKESRPLIYQFMLENRDIKLNIQGSLVAENNPLTEQYKAWAKLTDPYAKDLYFAELATDSLKRAIETLRKERIEVQKNYIRTHPGDYISLYWLRYGLKDNLAKQGDTLSQLYSILTPALKQLEEAKLLKKQIEIINALKPGLPAPAFSAGDAKGKLVSLSDFKGKYVLIDFWASWCVPCIAAMPEMKNTYARYKDKELEILGVSLDNQEKAWKDAVVKHGLPWVNISELKGWNGEIGKQYNITAIPQNVLIGKDGKILGVDINLAKDLPNLIK